MDGRAPGVCYLGEGSMRMMVITEQAKPKPDRKIYSSHDAQYTLNLRCVKSLLPKGEIFMTMLSVTLPETFNHK
jgi:hypothetical protein